MKVDKIVSRNWKIFKNNRYNDLIEVLNIFGLYRYGKKTIVELKELNLPLNTIQIKQNQHFKESYEKLLRGLQKDFLQMKQKSLIK